MATAASKSIWKSKSFLTGIATLITAIIIGYEINIPAGVLEGFLSLVSIVLIGKSASKRMG